MGCLVRILEDIVLCTASGGIIDTALLEDLGETLESTRGKIKW